MRPARYQLDRDLGLLYYYIDEDWGELGARVPRPDGFVVVEEVGGAPCTEFRGRASGRYAVYLMAKRGVDHFTAVREARRALGAAVRWLGIKDANAVTYQLVRVRAREGLPAEASLGRVELRLLGYWDGELPHTGNRFSIAVEGADEAELARRVEAVRAAGALPAYFGYQRFGVRRPNTHLVGRAIVAGDYEGAVDLLVGRPYPAEPEAARRFRELYDRGDLEGALEAAPRGYWIERSVIRALLRGARPLEALRAPGVPLEFFVEAYQAYLFNLCLSRLLEAGAPRDAVVEVPAAAPASGPCAEVMREEGVASLSPPGLGLRVRALRRRAFMEVRGLRLERGRLEFSLDRGMYATVVLREVLRQDPLTFA